MFVGSSRRDIGGGARYHDNRGPVFVVIFDQLYCLLERINSEANPNQAINRQLCEKILPAGRNNQNRYFPLDQSPANKAPTDRKSRAKTHRNFSWPKKPPENGEGGRSEADW